MIGRKFLVLAAFVAAAAAHAQMPMRPPAFIGGIPGLAQMQAMFNQRHQSRTALYREALEELRKNPQAADVAECPAGPRPAGLVCLQRPPEQSAAASPVAAQMPAPAPAPAAAAGAAQPAPAVPRVPPDRPARRLALLVGNNTYQTPIPPLETPVADVDEVARVLRARLGFEVRVLHNAGKPQIIEAINDIAREVGPEDSVLLLYAGHGYLMDDTRMGFWIPIDGSVKSPANWISNTDISKLLKAIPARQVILISDSCFSGSLTKEQKPATRSGKLDPAQIRKQRSVLAFSSGDEEPVSDEGKDGHSIFAYNLIKTLETTQGVSTGYDIYRIVHDGVTKDYPQQPQYGVVVSAGHVAGGEFLFETARP